MYLYTKNIIYNLVLPVIGTLLTLTFFVWLSQVIKMVYLISKGVDILYFASTIIMLLPYLLFMILPFGLAIGVTLGYHGMLKSREIIVLNNLGLSPLRIFYPALLLGIVATILSLFLSSYLLPISYTTLKSRLNFFRNNYTFNIVQEKTFTQLSKNTTIYVDKKNYNGILEGIVIIENTKEKEQIVTTFAESGQVTIQDDNPVIELRNGTRQIIDENNKSQMLSFGNLAIVLYGSCTNMNSSKCQDKVLETNNRSVLEHFIPELLNPKNVSESRKIKMRTEGHQRILWPMYNLALVAIVSSLISIFPYNRGNDTKLLITVSTAVAVIVAVHFLIYNAASKNSLINILSYINVALCMLISYYLTRKGSIKIWN